MAEIKRVKDASALYRAGADEFAAAAREAVDARGVFHVALSGGSTPRGMYELLAGNEKWRGQVAWDRVQFWWGDERTVPAGDAESNYRMAQDALLARVPVEEGQVHRMRGEMPDADQAAQEYEQELQAAFGATARACPQFDLILLGMGAEGHTASLFPGTRALNETTRWVVGNWVGKLYTWRITFTAPLINCARAVVFLVAGEDKALAIRGVLEGPYEPEQLPAQLVKPEEGRLVWMLDDKAAGQLGRK